MKNVKRLFLAAVLLSTSSMAAIVQPALPASGESACRVGVGVYTNMGKMASEKYGLEDLMGGINFTHYTGYDFFYGIGVGLGASSMGKTRLFTDEATGKSGFKLDTEISFGFLPEIADMIHLGVVGSVGWGKQFGEASKNAASAGKVKFGDLNVKAGLAFSVGFTESVALYITPVWAMTKIRFFEEGAPAKAKEQSGLNGMQIPVGLSFGVGEGVSMFVETTTKFANFKDFKGSHTQEVALGLAFTM